MKAEVLAKTLGLLPNFTNIFTFLNQSNALSYVQSWINHLVTGPFLKSIPFVLSISSFRKVLQLDKFDPWNWSVPVDSYQFKVKIIMVWLNCLLIYFVKYLCHAIAKMKMFVSELNKLMKSSSSNLELFTSRCSTRLSAVISFCYRAEIPGALPKIYWVFAAKLSCPSTIITSCWNLL